MMAMNEEQLSNMTPSERELLRERDEARALADYWKAKCEAQAAQVAAQEVESEASSQA